MSPLRHAFLAAANSTWLREQSQRRAFVRRVVARFMPGETLPDAVAAARALSGQRLGSILTRLGENVSDAAEARSVADHYLEVIGQVRDAALDAEVSVKLTQLGLDLGTGIALDNLARVAECARVLPGRLWIDMESSAYVGRTLEVLRASRDRHPRLGVALQAYLHRSAADLEMLIGLGFAVRVVKGAYQEPPSVAMTSKHDVDESYFRMSARLLSEDARKRGAWLAAGTHDPRLIARIAAHAESLGVPRTDYEFAMLYGIQRAEQARLAAEGHRCRVLISYGSYWFPWYMRRLAERPANVWFVVRGMVGH